MQIISQIIILGILYFPILNGMRKDQQLFQPQPLVSLAATALAKEIDPIQSLDKTYNAFKNANKIDSAIASLISNALLKRNQITLRTILQSQIPLTLQIDRYEQYPENIYASNTSGLYVRSKKEEYSELPDPLYAGIAQLIPDPFAQNAPHQFFQIYSNPNGTKYFDDDECERDASSRGICIWDKKSGARLNDGKAIRAKLLAKYTQIAEKDPELHDFLLYGISSDDSVAWCRFLYLSDVYKECVCAFKVDNNELLCHALGTQLDPLSHSGKFCLLKKNNSVEIVNSNTGSTELTFTQHAIVTGISPQDDYALVSRPEAVGTHVLNLETKELTQLTLDNNQFFLKNGIYNPLSRDGSLIAVLENNQIHILKVRTNELVCTIPAPNNEDDDTHYNLLFSPDSTQILTLKITFAASNNYDDTSYHLTTFDIATQQPVEILDASQIENGDDGDDFIFCNEGDYLLLPNGQLRIQPQGLVNHLSLQELIGLLILEKQKTQQQPIDATIIHYLQKNQFPKIQELIGRRYGIPFKQ